MATYIFNGECQSSIKQAFIDAYKPAPAYHADTWYKYANDTEWRTVSITGTISGSITRPTTQISNITNVVALEIGSDVTSIGNYAFQSCINLQNVTIPSAVTSIGEQAFIDCSSLTSMTIPSGVTSIWFATFSGCTSLTSVTIPDSVTSIGGYAFDNCSGLTSMMIPDSVTSIGDCAFYRTNNMQTITFENKTKSQVQSLQNYSWGAIYIGSGSYYPTITFVCSDKNITMTKEQQGNSGGSVN